MVTQSKLNQLQMESIEDYFDYIMESKINGQHKQARRLFFDLSMDDGMQHKGQRSHFFDYISDLYYYEALDNGEEDPIEELKKYFNNEATASL
jgi:hypothetical protein